MSNNNVLTLRADFERAEQEYRAAFRRAVWLERRLYDAPTEADYNTIAADLDAQEKRLHALGLSVCTARAAYAAAEFMHRNN